jgi:multiple sugar transport system ATP-binding protein
MKGGVVQQLGTPHEVYHRPANTFVAGFMGSPRMNLARAQVTDAAGALSLEFQTGNGKKITLHLSVQFSYLKRYLGQEVIAGIRPETINLPTANLDHTELQRPFMAKIEVIEPTGADTQVILNFGGNEFTATLEPDLPLNVGQETQFTVDLTKLVCFDAKTELLIA